ncbi:MAG: sigma-E processing peptidase SpoIIGA [Christensenellales bacterium]|jgi:stage II sporulation protein GA (sporulation sigma-E factor processing peptidase)
MEAYIEYVIIDNFAVDLLILLITVNILRLKVLKSLIILSSIAGTALAVAIPLMPEIAAIIMRALTAPVMCIMLKRYQSVKEYLITLLVMALTTFAIGGIIIAVFNMSLTGNFLYLTYPTGGIVGLTALGAILTGYILKQLVLRARQIPISSEIIYAEIFMCERRVKLKAFYDSGLNLYDKAGRPVLIISPEYEKHIVRCPKGDVIGVNTINGQKETNSYIIEKVLIYINGQVNTIYNVGCIVSSTGFNNYDLLLGREMLKEG